MSILALIIVLVLFILSLLLPTWLCSDSGWAQYYASAASAAVTLVAVVTAIWGEQIRHWYHHAEFEVVPNASVPSGVILQRQNGDWTWYCHLQVRNKYIGTRAKIRVCCTRIERRANTNDAWVAEQLPDRVPLCWCYSDVFGFEERTIGDSVCVDLAHIDANSDKMILDLGVCPNNVNRTIALDRTLRVHLGIEIDGWLQPEDFTVEISWDGKGSRDLSDIDKHVQVKVMQSVCATTNSMRKR